MQMKVSEIPQIKNYARLKRSFLLKIYGHEIAKDDTDICVPENHKYELDKRLDDHKKFPDSLLTLEKLQI